MKLIAVEDRAVFTHQLQNRRRRGRPRSIAPKVSITVRVPVAVFDAACKHAIEEGASLPEVVRETLAREYSPSTNPRAARAW